MSTNQTTADNTQHAGQHTGKLDTIANKLGGLGDIIRGTGEIIHGHIPGAGDSAHGGKAAIKTAGVQRVERGLDRIDGKPTGTSAAGGNAPAQDWERSRVGDSNGAAPTTAPQASTAAPRADDLTSQKDQGAAADTKHPVDRGAAVTTATAGATAADIRGNGPAPEQRHRDDDSERAQAAAPTPWTPPRDRPTIANGLDEHDANMSQQQQQQQGNGMVSSDRDKLYPENALTASPADLPTPVAAKRDTDGRQQVQENEPASGTSDEQTRTTDALDPVNLAAGRHDPSRPATSGSPPGVQGIHDDERQHENESASASLSDLPAAADAQSVTDVRQQVQENEPATGTSRTTSTDALDPANLATGRHDPSLPTTSDSPPGLQGYFDVRQQGNGSSSASPSDRPAAADAQSDTDVRQQVQENESATDTGRTTTADDLDPANLATGRHDPSRPATSDSPPGVQGVTDVENWSTSASPSASPAAADAQSDTDIRQQVQENEPATDTGRTTPTDALDPANLATGRHGPSRPATSDSSPSVQGITDVRQQGNWSASASPSASPAAADAQSNTDVRQQVQENEPATGSGRTTPTDALDPANLAAGRHDPSRPATSDSSPGVLGVTDVRQQGNWSASASPSASPAAADAQRDTDVRQQVQENEPATDTNDKQTRTITDALDPANLAVGPLGVQGVTDVRQQGNWSASASPSASPAAADAQRDTDVRQQAQENEPATDTSDKQTRTITDALYPANEAAVRHDPSRPAAPSSPPGVQGVTDVRQQGNWSASVSPSASSAAADAKRDTDVRQQVQENEPATDTSDMQTRTITGALDLTNLAVGPPDVRGVTDVRQQGNGSASASPGDPPTVADAKRDADVHQQVEENESATDTSDKQTRTITDALYPANEAAVRHDPSRPATPSSPPGVQGVTDVRQQVQENGPVTGTSDKQTRTTTDTVDPANLPTEGHDLSRPAAPAASGSPPGVQSVTDVRQQGNGSASSDRDKAHWQETRTTADTPHLVDTAVGQERSSGTVSQA